MEKTNMQKFCILAALGGIFLAASCGPPAAERELEVQREPPAHVETPRHEERITVAEDGELRMVADGYRFGPSEVRVSPGQSVRLTLTNDSSMPHNIEFEFPDGEVEFPQNLEPGETGTLEFLAPGEPGTYTFYCPVGNHREQGMEGVLIVEAGPTGR
jgi:plastocyanin